MGLIDGILGSLSGSVPGGSPQSGGGGLVQLALQLVQQSGGLTGVLEKFKAAGLGAQADSWVSTGKNLPVSSEQISQVLGGQGLSDLAGKLGVGQGDALSGLASMLPQLIDKLTPQGQVPSDHADLVSQGLAMLGKLGRG